MTAAADGTLETLDDGRARVRFQRSISHPLERVWAALTEPDQMRQWWAAADELELREGGSFVIRWELRADGDATALTFTSTLDLPEEYRNKVLAGWHFHLDALEDALEGRAVDWDNWPIDRWQEHHDRYAAAAGPAS